MDVEQLTLKQEQFCQAWVDLKGNGTQAALEVYDIENKQVLFEGPPEKYFEKGKLVNQDQIDHWYKLKDKIESVASSIASENLRIPEIQLRIDEILDERGFEDKTVKREHFKLIVDADDKTKRLAIRDYYELKGKLVKKLDLTTKGLAINSFREMTTEELEKIANGEDTATQEDDSESTTNNSDTENPGETTADQEANQPETTGSEEGTSDEGTGQEKPAELQ